MKGHEHYLEAERLTRHVAKRASRGDGADVPSVLALASLAQVHATLAHAAAAALPTVVQYMGDDRTVTDWADAIGHEWGSRTRGDA